MSPAAVSRVHHPALEEGRGRPLEGAGATDRDRLGVLLQGGALLAHLEHAGWHLPRAWSGARLDRTGRLRGVTASPGPSPSPPQSLLLELLRKLFPSDPGLAGRGQARRAARSLVAAWDQTLLPVQPDRALSQILEAAPFLWRRDFAVAREALAGWHRRRGATDLWVAGPGRFRRRILARVAGGRPVGRVLGSSESRLLWAGAPPAPGRRASSAWRATLVAGLEEPPRAAAERRRLAAACQAMGRFRRALTALRGLEDMSARILRLESRYQLGHLGAVRRSLESLPLERLSPEEVVRLAEVAVRALSNRGELEAAHRWVEEARRRSRGALGLRARILAALAAWDRGEPAVAAEELSRAAGAREVPSLAWRWRQARALVAMERDRAELAVEELSRALREHRRRLTVVEAGGLWNDLCLARTLAADLSGAEKAARHAARLLERCDGPRHLTLALSNLAEVRIRRGRLEGVGDLLRRVATANRRAGNWRGRIQDAELQGRLALARGCLDEAVEGLEGALDLLRRRRISWRRQELQVLAARARGWRRQPEAAARALGAAGGVPGGLLEPEELAPLHLLAGDRDGAAVATASGPGGRLWRAFLQGREPGAAAWEELEVLEEYRAARLVCDLERCFPGAATPTRLRRAVRILERRGAGPLAAPLRRRLEGPWEALALHLEDGGGSVEESLSRLFAGAGRGEVRLVWERGGEGLAVVEGRGGGERLAAPLAGGELVLEAAALDPVLRTLFALALRELAGALPRDPGPAQAGPAILGESPLLRRALARADRLAGTDLSLLILGETGTGKELLARRVHAGSRRRQARLVTVNCAALGGELLLSDLFGHVRGAFTGAVRDRAGVFEAARGGTVLLDEIGDLPAAAQGHLLRVLQEGEVRRVGESLPRQVDVRVLAATHRDLEERTRGGGFRRDLLYRLQVGVVKLPPLRRRGSDVVLLAEHFLGRRADGAAGPARLSREACRVLESYSWPGNVRQLENVVTAAAVLSGDGVVLPRHLELPAADGDPGGYHQQVLAFRRRLVREALEASGGCQAEAARRLGLTRQAVSYLVGRFGLGGGSLP